MSDCRTYQFTSDLLMSFMGLLKNERQMMAEILQVNVCCGSWYFITSSNGPALCVCWRCRMLFLVCQDDSKTAFFLFLTSLSFLFFPSFLFHSFSSEPKPVPRWLSWVGKQLHNQAWREIPVCKPAVFHFTCSFSSFPMNPVWSVDVCQVAVLEWKHEETG